MPILAAFDIGTGATKVQVARVSADHGVIEESLFSHQSECHLGADLIQSGKPVLSTAILTRLYSVVEGYISKAKELGATSFRGVGTAVFRKAENAKEAISHLKDQFDLVLHIISQAEEGELGYNTALGACTTDPEFLQDKDGIISWDSGGGSFQICVRNKEGDPVTIFEGPMGAATVTGFAVEMVGRSVKETKSPNPVSMTQYEELRSIVRGKLSGLAIPPSLQQAIAGGRHRVVSIGGVTSIFRLINDVLGVYPQSASNEIVTTPANVTPAKAAQAIASCVDKETKELMQYPEPEMVIPKIALLHTVLEHFGFQSVNYFPTTGGTNGILLTARYWQ